MEDVYINQYIYGNSNCFVVVFDGALIELVYLLICEDTVDGEMFLIGCLEVVCVVV